MWLREIAESTFEWRWDRMRFDPGEPQAMNARVESALLLARIYAEGNGVPRKWEEAERWYWKAVEFGFIPALDILGQAYLKGQGAEKNVSRAIDCFKRAADAGYGPAAYDLGGLYYVGAEGVKPDLKLAAAYFELAAKAGHPAALFAVGRMYELGEAWPADPDKAATFYKMAVEQGDANAEFALAALHPGSKRNRSDQVATAYSTPVETPQSGSRTSAMTALVERRDDDGGVPVVRVTGLRVIAWKSYRAMRAAIAAYEKYKYLAPESMFSFAVLPPAGKTLPENFELRVRTKDGTEFPVKLDNGMLFQLPVLPDPEADASLVSNLKEGQLRIGLLLHSRNVPPEEERLGDIRLRNEISQAIGDVEHPNVDSMCWKRRSESRCRPRHVTVWYKPRAPASVAWLVEGSRKEVLEHNGDLDYPSYKIPVNAGHLGNDAIIEFAYRKPLGSIKQTVVMIYDERDR